MHKENNMLIIRDEDGEIVGAQVEDSQVEDSAGNYMSSFISPAKPGHTLYRVSNVPAEILDLKDPMEFHKAITRHVNSEPVLMSSTPLLL
jgi:hypothetical protein